jgi:predicted MPP superfamily phosphohydrolase
MKGIPSSFLLLFYAFALMVELLSYFGIRLRINHVHNSIPRYLNSIYIAVSFFAFGIMIFTFSNPVLIRHSHYYLFLYLISYLNLVPKFFLAFMTIISFLLRWLFGKRVQMLIISGSLILSLGIFIVIGYAFLLGRYNIHVEQKDLYFDELPQQLEGLKIVQLSDIHLGSFGGNPTVMNETVKLVNILKPDLLLFTGDIVNNFSDEIEGFEPYLQALSANYGKYAIMGNHDYGDYSSWPDSSIKNQNLAKIREGLVKNGFKLLLNKWVKIEVQDTSFALIGVENWGHPPFKKYANLDQAMAGIPQKYFRILMTHDPEHWNSIVVPNTDIPLTLAGHTHGGQFGIKIAGIEFSPIYLTQKKWGGLYRSDNQLLYVNRGLGTIAFQGRIEMRPEITVITIHQAKNH